MIRPALIFLLSTIAAAGMAGAQDMRRCVLADGTVVHTDGQCEMGQVEKPAVATGNSPATGMPGRIGMTAPPACSASAEQLLFNVRTAIDSRDVNLLARSYHWPGLSEAQVDSVLGRLEKLVQQPLIDLQLLYPEISHMADAGMPEALPASTPPPYGLKLLQQGTAGGAGMTTTRFALLRHFGCWWIRY